MVIKPQWVRALTPQSEGVGVQIPAMTDLSHKTGSDSSPAKRSAISTSITGARR